MDLQIVYLPPEELRPYENNARKHAPEDVDAIKASIRELGGFNDPIGIWGKDNIIVEGHGRLIAAKQMGLERVPCIRLDHLTDEQRRAYALAHNKTAELSEWDFAGKLEEELAALEIAGFDMAAFGFENEANDSWFDRRERDGDARQEGNDEYNDFLDKFEPKKTTDDCYTPDNVYDAVAEWVAQEYEISRSAFVRPFYPGGDYQREKYPKGCVVVDNPPFSILSEIIKWYNANGVKFFLFAPTLSLFTAVGEDVTYLPVGVTILYENGATVNTSFITNLDDVRLYMAASLFEAVDAANTVNEEAAHKNLPKFSYPDEVVLSARVYSLARYGQTLRVPKDECIYQNRLDAQKEAGKDAFGGLFLLSERMTAERAAAERAAAERAAAERAAAEKWELSDREREIVRSLGK